MPTYSRRLYYDPDRYLDVWCDQEEDGQIIFRHVHQAWREILEYNREYAKENPKNVHVGNTQKHMVKVGEIPLQVWMDLKERGIANDPKALRRWLSDPDNRHFKTYEGRI